MTDNPIARPVPITPQDREFIAQVEGWLPDALLEEVARELAPTGHAPDQLVRDMGEAEPGGRLRKAVEAAMTRPLFATLPDAERSAAADQATLAAAQLIDSRLTIERKEPTSRLGDVTGKVAGKVVNLAFRATYRELAHDAAHKASERLSGALTWSQRHAGAVAPASAKRLGTTNAASSAKPPGSTKDNHHGPIARD